MVDHTNYLNLYDIVRNELIGDTNLFLAAVIISVNYVCLRYRLPYQLTIMFNVFIVGILFEKTRNLTLWAYTILAVSFFFYYTLKKIFDR